MSRYRDTQPKVGEKITHICLIFYKKCANRGCSTTHFITNDLYLTQSKNDCIYSRAYPLKGYDGNCVSNYNFKGLIKLWTFFWWWSLKLFHYYCKTKGMTSCTFSICKCIWDDSGWWRPIGLVFHPNKDLGDTVKGATDCRTLYDHPHPSPISCTPYIRTFTDSHVMDQSKSG